MSELSRTIKQLADIIQPHANNARCVGGFIVIGISTDGATYAASYRTFNTVMTVQLVEAIEATAKAIPNEKPTLSQ